MSKHTPPTSKMQAELAAALDAVDYDEQAPALHVAELPPDPSPYLPPGYYLLDEAQDRTPYKLAYPPEYFAYAKALYDEAETRPLPPPIPMQEAYALYRIAKADYDTEAKRRIEGNSGGVRLYLEMWANKHLMWRFYWACCQPWLDRREARRKANAKRKREDRAAGIVVHRPRSEPRMWST